MMATRPRNGTKPEVHLLDSLFYMKIHKADCRNNGLVQQVGQQVSHMSNPSREPQASTGLFQTSRLCIVTWSYPKQAVDDSLHRECMLVKKHVVSLHAEGFVQALMETWDYLLLSHLVSRRHERRV